MNKTGIRYGLISSLLVILLLTPTWLMMADNSYSGNFALGTIAMAIALIPVVLAVLKRRQFYGGQIGFSKALLTGLLVSAFACVTYTVLWMVLSSMYPQIIETMWASYLKGLGENVSTEDLEAFSKLKESYSNPTLKASYTFFEMAMYAIPVSLISALVLKRTK